MDKYKKLAMVMCSVGLMFLLTGITYSFFNYTRTGDDNVLVTGDIYMHLDEGQDEITLTNIFPETKEEARARNDNTITFTLNGLNESNRDIYYEIDLIHGSDLSGYTRFNDSDLKFDLIEVGSNNEETYLVDAGSYSDLTNRRIWVDTVDANTLTEIEKTYKLRMWLSENVTISDTDPNASYPATGANAFKNHFASIKVKVIGDFEEKILPGAFYVLAKNVDTETLINFANNSSDSNGKGIYRLPGTENDTYSVYYYRGDIDNNNVLFAGFCWQIVRTTDTGGIKMIYNGLPDILGSGDNITYNCGVTRDIQDTISSTKDLGGNSGGYYYADDYDIMSTIIAGNSAKYKLKGQMIHRIISNATDAASIIPDIVANYPYTCLKTTSNATCDILYKVDSYASGTNAIVYSSLDRTIIGNSKFNNSSNQISSVGYMSNEGYPYQTGAPATGAYFGTDIEYGKYDSNNPEMNVYRLVDNGNDSVGTTLNDTHHYTCNETTATGTCSTVRYYYYKNGNQNYYINLTGGEKVEDALYKMTGNGSDALKSRNGNYILNQNSSIIKEELEIWFKENLTNEVDNTKIDYKVYLEDTVYCGDRSFKTIGDSNLFTQSGWNSNGGSLSGELRFGASNRVYNSWYSTTNIPAVNNKGEVPNIECPKLEDRFSVSNTKARLNYPVGLLTADEVIMAGVRGSSATSNIRYYLYTKSTYWTMSPARCQNYSASNYLVDSNGGILNSANPVDGAYGVRPVISLKLGVEFEDGGDGTPTNPYIVKY